MCDFVEMSKKFIEMRDLLMKHFNEMCSSDKILFVVDESKKDELADLYFNGFKPEDNPIFRMENFHTCSCCKNFIRNVGLVVSIDKDLNLETIWDFDAPYYYKDLFKQIDLFVKDLAIQDIFLTREKHFGCKKSVERVTGIEFSHFYVDVDKKYVTKDYKLGELIGRARDNKNVFKRSLDELTIQSLEDVLELINDNNLYRGIEYKKCIEDFLSLKKEYDKLDNDILKERFTWYYSRITNNLSVVKIKNTAIGVLLSDISEGKDFEESVKKFEYQIVGSTNYKRPKEIFTKKQLEDGKKAILELGYENSLGRKFASLDDIGISPFKFIDIDANEPKSDVLQTTIDNLFNSMEETIAVNPNKLRHKKDISIEEFMKLAPSFSHIEALFEGRLSKNLMSLIGPTNLDAKPLFYWNNPFSWSYKGNLADSNIKENVAKAGGAIDGVLRFSIQWNDNKLNLDDLDAHCKTPNTKSYGTDIAFYHKRDEITRGELDVDIIDPNGIAVENITFPSLRYLVEGDYEFGVRCYTHRNGRDGFRAEIEFNGELHQFSFNSEMRTNDFVRVALIHVDENKNITLKKTFLDDTTGTRTIWNINTNKFIPVKGILLSPNYWIKKNEKGNKHYFFILKNCINDETPNGFYNEFLTSELQEHRRVLASLGSKTKVPFDENQLSGIGFSSTLRNNLIVRATVGDCESVIYNVIF